ncbi:helix-turn-helix domain-containing protein [Bacillus nitroreducens]
MNITYRSILILFALQKLKGERTVYGIFHLLNGKKSSQTIGDANLFNLTMLFGILKPLERLHFEKEIQNLLEHGLIHEIELRSNKFITTSKGKILLKSELEQKPIPEKLEGWKYHDKAILFWRRLSLLTQVLSNLIDNKTQYTPIQQDESVFEWVKGFLKRKGQNRFSLSETLYQEVLGILEMVSELEATIFVMRLTSSKRIGYTMDQISSLLNEDETWCQVLFFHTLHTIIGHLETNHTLYPILALITDSQHANVTLTASTKTTYQMIMQGKTIEEIAKIRNLKRNTIEDHVVEVTHQQPDFSIEPYVPIEHQQLILSKYKETPTRQLRPLKEKLPEGISYFEIRLVLAKFGGKYES